METYLAIITTVLVATQIIRVVQNAISLHIQNKQLKKNLADLEKMNPTVEDFETQREVMRLLYEKLKNNSSI